MAGEGPRFVLLLGLEVTDEARYARYRAEMAPILASHGGAFGSDFRVSEVLKSPGSARINRVFTLSFPDRAHRERFLADPLYRSVRAAHFEPAVASTTVLAELEGVAR
jgi:uncharacterized protein (DUF1330 family)